jgi:hypothetical protein
MQAAETLVLIAVVAALYWLLTPLRRRLEVAIARLIASRRRGPRGKVVALARRSDGTFEREEERRR